MRSFFIILTCLTFGVWALWSRYHYTCKIQNLCGLVSDDMEDDIGPISGLTVTMDGKPVLTGYDHFLYKPNAVKPEMTPNNDTFLMDLAAYMNANPASSIKIGGKYLPSETYKGILETVGLARADHIRKLLEAKGLNASRLNIDSDPLENGAELRELLSFEGSSGKVAEKLKTENEDSLKLEEPKPGVEKKEDEKLVVAKFEFTNMTFSDVSFDKGSARFTPVRNFEMYADSVGRYLKDHPDKMLTIIGHTDSDGETEMNEGLGRRRAEAVKSYFINKHKVNSARIKTDTRGEREPVAPNDSEANMRKNRRVNMQIN